MRYFVRTALAAVALGPITMAAAAIVPLSGGVWIPTPPPYFVRAWTDTAGGVRTMESTDGMSWARMRLVPGSVSSDGPALAFDGAGTWMAAWNAGGAVSFVTGASSPATPAGGITWGGASSTLPTSVAVSGTPTMAFGNGNFVAVMSDGTGMLRLVPSMLPVPSAPTDMPLGFAGRDPHLAFGKGRFVLTYIADQNLLARTSVDGACWSAPRIVFPLTHVEDPEGLIIPTGVSLSFSGDAFVATGKLIRRFPPTDSDVIGHSLAVYRSLDGVTWQTVTNGGPNVDVNSGIPGAAFAQCQLALAYDTAPFGSNVGNQSATPDLCTAPSMFSFGTATNLAVPTTAAAGRKMAVVFSQPPGPFLASNPALSAPGSIGFGMVPVGDVAQRTLTIRNTSPVPLSISLASSTSGVFRWSGFNGDIACGGQRSITIEFSPTGNGAASRSLTFSSNTGMGTSTVALSGRGSDSVQPL